MVVRISSSPGVTVENVNTGGACDDNARLWVRVSTVRQADRQACRQAGRHSGR